MWALAYGVFMWVSIFIFGLARHCAWPVQKNNTLERYLSTLTDSTSTKEELLYGVIVGAVLSVMAALVLFGFWVCSFFLHEQVGALFALIPALCTWHLLSELQSNRYKKWTNYIVTVSVKITITCFVSTVWLVYPSWLTYDGIFMLIIYFALSHLGKSTITIPPRTLVVAGLLFILFDIWGVVITGFSSQLVLDSAVKPPLIFIVPAQAFPLQLDGTGVGLGMADVFIAGYIVCKAAALELGLWALIGYASGLLLTLYSYQVLQFDIPALVLLVPAICISVSIGRYVHH
jgi:hypothetical protein